MVSSVQVEPGWISLAPRLRWWHAHSWWASQEWRLELGRVLGTVARLVLHGPQRPQCGLLRLGQPSNPCDIQALIGPVAAQGAQQLGALQVPEPDGPVIAATGQPVPVGTHLERLDCPRMRLLHPRALPTLDL